MNPSDRRREIETLLEGEVENATRLFEVLQTEQAALANHDVAALEGSVADKQEWIAKLEELGRRRNDLLQIAGIAAGEDGMGRYIRECANDEQSPLKALLEKLGTLAEQCRRQNELNGSIVETNRRHVQQLLSILRGLPGPAELYGPDGGKTIESQGQTLAKA